MLSYLVICQHSQIIWLLTAILLTKPRDGEGGIRTPEGCDTLTDFESAAFDHSATSPTAKALFILQQ